MKYPLPLLLLLALPAVAQYRPMYSPSRPSYTPSYRPSTVNNTLTGPSSNYRAQQLQQQQAHQNFQRMQDQQRQQMQQYYYNQQRYLTRQPLALRRPPSAQQLEQLQAQQQQAEQRANEQLAQLTQEQQHRRQEHPAANAQEAENQQKEDARQRTRLAVKSYQEVFLPGQMRGALQSLTLAPQAQQSLQALNNDLLRNAWWRQQEAAQMQEKVAAYSKTLAGLTADLLGFSAAELPSPPAPFSASALQEMLSHDAFDQATAAQLIREATLADKRLEGERLAQAVKDFTEVGAKLAADPATPQNQKSQRNEVKKRLQRVNQELQSYYARMSRPSRLQEAQKAIMQATDSYLAGKGS
ncbi:hypothetical protein GKZ68_06220 [Hymenobacter sp. BRD128]|uniref:hypothetical protein n=1 Tax=Hymenobacter sp. BRD128 TaxID=2675878 RepID=UPI0015637D56|nr:hypothetical protein [Hymenobacter sp. BRD128]QKG56270.1 hypothetical protein GKZ68_06220 [Hymenobacter sp. BRD128]